ncbi:MAG: hypothetical protein WCF04_14535 [Candidatus Nanopelagicales bacterium]
MRTAPPALLPILRSALQGELLALLYLNPQREFSLTEAARLCRASVKTLHHEVNRLSTAGFLDERRLGNVRLIRAGDPGPIRGPLTELLAATYGPIPVLERELADIPGIEQALIHGSWAARHAGQLGPVPHDVDVLVIGTADRDALDDAARRAETVLHREVNIRRVTRDRWDDPAGDPFLTAVAAGPTLTLTLDSPEAGQR